MQSTRFSKINEKLNIFFFGFLQSSWKSKSLNLLSVLGGFFLFTNLISNFISNLENKKFIVVPIVIIFFELIIRIKPRSKSLFFVYWNILDKFRIGGIYALILEAYKLGS